MPHYIQFDINKVGDPSYKLVTGSAHHPCRIVSDDNGTDYPISVVVSGYNKETTRHFNHKGEYGDEDNTALRIVLQVKTRYKAIVRNQEIVIWDTIEDRILTNKEVCDILNK